MYVRVVNGKTEHESCAFSLLIVKKTEAAQERWWVEEDV
jgi:hypothetical protein